MELDQVQLKYESLYSVGIEISQNNYWTLVINFLPSNLSSFIAQISANIKMMKLASGSSSITPIGDKGDDPLLPLAEQLMQSAIEEWEC